MVSNGNTYIAFQYLYFPHFILIEMSMSRIQIELNEAHVLAKNGLLSLSITVGLKVLNAMMVEEVEEKAGKKGKHNKDRNAYRHGTEQSSVVLGGQKAKIDTLTYKCKRLA